MKDKEQNTEEWSLKTDWDYDRYAHFLVDEQYPGYYCIWVRDRTPEEMESWLIGSPSEHFKRSFSLVVKDNEFRDYMLERYTDQIPEPFLKARVRIDDVSNPQQWVEDYATWKEEKEKRKREYRIKMFSEEKEQLSLF